MFDTPPARRLAKCQRRRSCEHHPHTHDDQRQELVPVLPTRGWHTPRPLSGKRTFGTRRHDLLCRRGTEKRFPGTRPRMRTNSQREIHAARTSAGHQPLVWGFSALRSHTDPRTPWSRLCDRRGGTVAAVDAPEGNNTTFAAQLRTSSRSAYINSHVVQRQVRGALVATIPERKPTRYPGRLGASEDRATRQQRRAGESAPPGAGQWPGSSRAWPERCSSRSRASRAWYGRQCHAGDRRAPALTAFLGPSARRSTTSS